MQKNNKFFSKLINLVEAGFVSSKELKEELENIIKFKVETIINKLKLVKREEFEVQQEMIKKIRSDLDKMKLKKNKIKKK